MPKNRIRMLVVTVSFSIFAAALWLFVVSPLQALYTHNKEQLYERSALLSRLAAISAYDAADLQPVHSDEFRIDYLGGEQDSLIVAGLQTQLRAIVVGNASELLSAQSLPPRKIGSHTFLGLRIQISGELKSIHQIVRSVEYGSPLLFIHRASIHVEETFRTMRAARPATPPMLAELDIYGAKWPADSAAK